MNFTNTDCVGIREYINNKVMDQVCWVRAGIPVVLQLHDPVMEIHSQIRPKISQEIDK